MANRTQALVLGFFPLVWAGLVVILMAPPAVYDQALRTLPDTFSGIRPADVVAFIPAQLVGAAVATALMRWLYPQLPARAGQAVVAHEQPRDTSAGAAGRPAGARRARL
jgi:hypothetical protein